MEWCCYTHITVVICRVKSLRVIGNCAYSFPSSASDFPREDCEDSSFGDFFGLRKKMEIKKIFKFSMAKYY